MLVSVRWNFECVDIRVEYHTPGPEKLHSTKDTKLTAHIVAGFVMRKIAI